LIGRSAYRPDRHCGSQPRIRPAYISPARLLKRTFQIDSEHCPNNGGAPKLRAAVLESAVIERELTHLGLQVGLQPL